MTREQFERLKRGDIVKSEIASGVQILVFKCHKRKYPKSGNSWTGSFASGRRAYEFNNSEVDLLLNFEHTKYKSQIESAVKQFNKFHQKD
jgi:hypothetical protein